MRGPALGPASAPPALDPRALSLRGDQWCRWAHRDRGFRHRRTQFRLRGTLNSNASHQDPARSSSRTTSQSSNSPSPSSTRCARCSISRAQAASTSASRSPSKLARMSVTSSARSPRRASGPRPMHCELRQSQSQCSAEFSCRRRCRIVRARTRPCRRLTNRRGSPRRRIFQSPDDSLVLKPRQTYRQKRLCRVTLAPVQCFHRSRKGTAGRPWTKP